MSTGKETKSPIKNPPARVPGQSLDEKIDRICYDKMLEPFMLAVFLCLVAVWEWSRWYFNLKPMPGLMAIMAVAGIAWAYWRIRPLLRQLKSLRLGRDGERAVGQYLEEVLRPLQFQILHDIPGDAFNLDHVVIGPTGIFCIETKTRSKPMKGSQPIQYDGETLIVNGIADRDPIVQAKAASHWLHDILKSSTGKSFTVQPVVVFPGWYVDKMPAHAEVWVLNEKAASTFIQNARTASLASDDVALIVFHLKQYIMAKEREIRT